MVMGNTVVQAKGVPYKSTYSQSGTPTATLLVGHSYAPIVGGIGIAIAGVQKIKNFFGKIEPAIGIKVLGVVLSHSNLKIALKIGYHFMKGFCGRGKIIRVVYSLLVEIHMDMGQPLVENFYALPTFDLCEPCPIPI